MYVLLCMGWSKGKQGYKSDVPGIQIVVPRENKPLIQTCNWYFSLYYRYNITTIDCEFELVSICKVKSSFFSLNLVAKCFLYPNGCCMTMKSKLLKWAAHMAIIRIL